MPDPRRLAAVVEGQTEVLFLERLLRECANTNQICIRSVLAQGGRSAPRTVVEIKADSESGQPYYVLVYCSGTDSRVPTDVLDNYVGWANKGYVGIIGLRDLYPQPLARAFHVRQRMSYRQRTRPIKVVNILAIAEVEAWFVAEATHYCKVNAGLTAPVVVSTLGFDPAVHDVETIGHPADELHRVYSSAGLAYRKDRNQINRTVDSLDMAEIAFVVAPRVPALGILVDAILAFLNGASWNELIPSLSTPPQPA